MTVADKKTPASTHEHKSTEHVHEHAEMQHHSEEHAHSHTEHQHHSAEADSMQDMHAHIHAHHAHHMMTTLPLHKSVFIIVASYAGLFLAVWFTCAFLAPITF